MRWLAATQEVDFDSDAALDTDQDNGSESSLSKSSGIYSKSDMAGSAHSITESKAGLLLCSTAIILYCHYNYVDIIFFYDVIILLLYSVGCSSFRTYDLCK